VKRLGPPLEAGLLKGSLKDKKETWEVWYLTVRQFVRLGEGDVLHRTGQTCGPVWGVLLDDLVTGNVLTEGLG
jgi:hypothetical protein